MFKSISTFYAFMSLILSAITIKFKSVLISLKKTDSLSSADKKKSSMWQKYFLSHLFLYENIVFEGVFSELTLS